MATYQEALLLLEATISRAGTPPAAQLAEFKSAFRFRTIEKATLLARTGEHSTKVWFLAEGVVRMFYERPDGQEFNKAFLRSGQFVAALDSLVTSDPATLSIETISDCSLLEAPYEAIVALRAKDAYWERLGRIIVETLYVAKVRREAALLMDTATVRYERFMNEMKELAEIIPNYQIASYLGIAPETLSRIRNARAKQRHKI